MLSPANAKAESKSIDFKLTFDPDQLGEWCELLKDVVAMANSGGGSILIGVANDGQSVGGPAALKILQTDPAVFTDKVVKYTGVQFDSFTIGLAKRKRRKIALVTIGRADPPMMFEKEGVYNLQSGKPKSAFAAGTLYVRHGAKSEPARSADIIRLIERSVSRARREWLSGVRRVTSAPRGSTVSILPPQVIPSSDPNATPIRITDNPDAPEYQLIDPDKTHPWRQKELLEELNKALPTKLNQYDLLAVRRIYGIDDDKNFVHKSRFGVPQYSPLFAKWLLEQHSSDPTFFEKARVAFKRVGNVHPITDERLGWLAEFARTNNLAMSSVARLSKINATILSKLLSGKYEGDVEKKLEQINNFRQSIEQSKEELDSSRARK